VASHALHRHAGLRLSFNMGFMTIICRWAGLLWTGDSVAGAGNRLDSAGGLIAALAWLAHPIGFLWLVGTLAYVSVRAKMPGWRKLAMPLAAASGFGAVCWYAAHRPALMADWDRGPFYLYNGADQLGLYGERYFALAVRDSFLDLFAWRWISISGGAAVFPGKHSNCRSNCTR